MNNPRIAKADRKLTNEIIEVSDKNVFHFVHSEYKPWWHAGEIVVEGKEIELDGYNSGGLEELTEPLIDKLIAEGKMLPEQDYLIEVAMRITKLEYIE